MVLMFEQIAMVERGEDPIGVIHGPYHPMGNTNLERSITMRYRLASSPTRRRRRTRTGRALARSPYRHSAKPIAQPVPASER
jgi:hypothetical protein